ncbi:hypothetical protein AABB24_017502 [Solanum stoloniferum]|uniref:Retrotransposon gag domain-containing protein n=1 Tax=Solanum stoloniferum TaxID=62892 RepID=A0ABD2TMW4_9SOLN
MDTLLRFPEGRLSKLLQMSAVAEFRTRFEAISNETVHLPDEFLIRCFISGLRSDIQDEVAIREPTSLEEAIRLANMYEQKLNYAKSPVRPAFARIQPLLPNLTTSSPLIQSKPTAPSSAFPEIPFKRLTSSEIQARQDKGLCYNCDEKYSIGHKCKTLPQFLLLEESSESSIELPNSCCPKDFLAEELQCLEGQAHSTISYHALLSGTSHATPRFNGHVLLDFIAAIATRVSRLL